MKNWLKTFGQKMQAWMYGRYGYDEFSKFLSITALVCIVLAGFFPLLSTVGLILLIWSTFRTYSKNIAKRQKERSAYLKYIGKIKQSVKLRKCMWRDRRTHRYYKCPTCKAWLRVPKGRGEITITCSVCKNKIDRTT